jgi:hypothetical protein
MESMLYFWKIEVEESFIWHANVHSYADFGHLKLCKRLVMRKESKILKEIVMYHEEQAYIFAQP